MKIEVVRYRISLEWVESIIFGDGLNIGWGKREGKRSIKDVMGFGLINWKDDGVINWVEENKEGECLGNKSMLCFGILTWGAN